MTDTYTTADKGDTGNTRKAPGITMTASKILRIIREFRKMHRDISAQVIEVYLTVAMNEGIQVHQIAEKMGVASATASRHCAFLGKVDRRRNPGLDLIVVTEVYDDRRFKECKLTTKGKMVLESLRDIME